MCGRSEMWSLVTLVTSSEILSKAYEEAYMVPGCDGWNLESIQAIVDGAQDARSPIILQVWAGELDYPGLEYWAAIAKIAASKATVPVAINLDHGKSFQSIMPCIRAGFTSVHITPPSSISTKEQIAIVKQIVDVAHAVGVSVEADMGPHPYASQKESERESMTEPEEAGRFAEETGLDGLAVSIGNVGGLLESRAKLDLDRLREIRKLVRVPLVLHGGTGVPEESYSELARLGVAKICFASVLWNTMTRTIKEASGTKFSGPFTFHPKNILGIARSEVKRLVEHKTMLCGSAGRSANGGAGAR
jgi:fructose-bisphosphate aldolase class II